LLVQIVLLGSMAEPSLLCVNCARPPPPHRRTWGRCTVCIARNLPSTYYCGEECMNAHWQNGHREYHKEQKLRAKVDREGTLQLNRSVAEEEARRAEATGSEFDKRFADAVALNAKGDYHAEAKAWRKLIKERPDEPVAYHNLGIVLQQSRRLVEAAPMFLKAMELHEDGTKEWANSTATAFDILKTDACSEEPKPEWWNDEALKALSAQVVALASDEAQPCVMRGRVLMGAALHKVPWNAGPRNAAEIKEAATWLRRASERALTTADVLLYEDLARRCDEVADPLLAEEEAEAADARAASLAEAAEALKVAEAKAKASADELLAEEEKEKEQASTKAGKTKQGKGKKGKGRR